MEIINNKCKVTGVLSTEFKFDHEAYGEFFFKGFISCKRKSGEEDFIPVCVSEKILDMSKKYVNKYISVSGRFKSHNKNENGKSKLLLVLFAAEIEFVDQLENDENEFIAAGYICKKPIYRRTPLGREIADFILAINRPYGKSDYIPCICWGRNARFSERLEVGSHIFITGRIQSRNYLKKVNEEEYEQMTTYEVSVAQMEVIND